MRFPKTLVGKEVRITWRDPCSSERMSLEKARVGQAALAVWRERGLVDDVTDGVVRLIQSEATSPGDNHPDEAILGWIPEDLIIKIEVGEYKELE